MREMVGTRKKVRSGPSVLYLRGQSLSHLSSHTIVCSDGPLALFFLSFDMLRRFHISPIVGLETISDLTSMSSDFSYLSDSPPLCLAISSG